jgi:hypothetical protein
LDYFGSFRNGITGVKDDGVCITTDGACNVSLSTDFYRSVNGGSYPRHYYLQRDGVFAAFGLVMMIVLLQLDL